MIWIMCTSLVNVCLFIFISIKIKYLAKQNSSFSFDKRKELFDKIYLVNMFSVVVSISILSLLYSYAEDNNELLNFNTYFTISVSCAILLLVIAISFRKYRSHLNIFKIYNDEFYPSNSLLTRKYSFSIFFHFAFICFILYQTCFILFAK